MTSTLNILLDVSIYIIISSKYIYLDILFYKIKIPYNYLSKIKDQTFNYKKYISLSTQNSFISILWNCLPCAQLINKFFLSVSVLYIFCFSFSFLKNWSTNLVAIDYSFSINDPWNLDNFLESFSRTCSWKIYASKSW